MTKLDQPTRHIANMRDADDALQSLQSWLRQAKPSEVAGLMPKLEALFPGHFSAQMPELSRVYPSDFKPSAAYKATMPDLQNGPAALIRGSDRRLQHVGIHNFRLPLRYQTRDGAPLVLETSVTGTVSLEPGIKGINMSRIMRSFYAHAEQTFSFETIGAALDDYKRDLDSLDARIQLRLSFPMRRPSLRSGLEGWQYYDLTLEMVEALGQRQKIVHLDYVYSSTCPCSLELSEHARAVRGQLATPHSQRSVARVSALMADAECPWFEELIELCRAAVPTETQVMVKREDEQAFAELNAANPIFVEDAARLFAQNLQEHPLISEYRVVTSHQESLHSHDAVSVVTEGDYFPAIIEPELFTTLIHQR